MNDTSVAPRQSPEHPAPATGDEWAAVALPVSASDRRRLSVWGHVLALAGYLAATLVFTWPLIQNFTTAIPGDSFDGWQNYWNLWWLRQALVERLVNPLFTDQLYAPTGVGLYFHTLNPFNGLSTLPVQLAFGLIPAYNIVVMMSWVLAGYGMFLLARWEIFVEGQGARGENPYRFGAFVAPFVAGLVYTLSPFHMAHLLGHMQVMSLQWIPFYLLALLRSLRLAEEGRVWLRPALWAGLFLVFIGLCDWYFVLYLFLFTGFAILWRWLVRPGRPSARALLRVTAPALVAGLVFAVALSFWLAPMVLEATRFHFMVRPSADLYILSASVMDFLIPNRLHTLFRPESFAWIGNQIAPVSERTIAIGYVALALAIAALSLARRRALFWWVAAVFFLMLALGPQWHVGDITLDAIPAAALNGQDLASWTPYGILNKLIPFMRISRSVSRFAVMVQLCMGVLAAIGFWQLAIRMRRGRHGSAKMLAASLTVFAIGALLFEYWVAPYPLSPPDTPAYYSALANDPDPRAVLNLPMNYDRPGYLLYQTVHGKPLTVAYISRDDPRTLTERVPVLQHFRHLGPDIIDVDPAAVAATVFSDLSIGTVILDRYKMPGGEERTYTENLASAIFAGQQPEFEDDRITVYRVGTAAAPQPYLMLGALDWGPLTASEGATPYRILLGDRAEIIVQHPPEAGVVAVRYASDAPAVLSAMLAGDDTVLASSEPSTAGELRIDLAEVRRAAQATGLAEAPLSLRVYASGDAPMRVEQIALHMPPMQATVSPSTVLDSYRLRARYQMTSSLEDGSEVQQRVETDATWLRTTGPFGFDAQIDMQVASPDEQNELRYVLVGRSAASKSHGEWMTAPRGPDPLADDPNGLIGLPLAASLVQGERLGVDEISGIETTHYRVTDPAFFASMFGRSAPGKGLTAVALDGWVAPAGYLVRYLLNAETAEGSAVDVQGNVLPALNQRIEIEYELTEVNGPVQIVWPADAPPSGALILPGFVRSNFPLPDDAVVVSGPGYIQIQTQLEPVAAQRFFETELTAQGWRLDGEAGAYRAVKGAARMTLMIAQNAQADGGVTVQIRPGELPD